MARRRIMGISLKDPETGRGHFIGVNDPLPEWADEETIPEKAFAHDGDEPEYDLQSMTVKQLLALAKKRGVELFSTTKADIIAALEGIDDDADDE